MSENDDGAEGFLDQSTTSSEYNAFFFKVMGILAQNNFNVVVEVMAVKSAGELALAGVIDVRPLVNQRRPDGVAVPHETIHGVSYLRMQGGLNAIIMDPVVGDKGIMMCSDKDISSVKANRAAANPGSFREHDYSDGVYMGGFLNAIPTQYVQFNSDGIEMHSPTKIKLTAPVIELTATTSITEAAPNIAMNASTKVATTSPAVQVTASGSITESTATYALIATTSAGITSPTTTITGLATVTGLASLNGGFSSLPTSGGSGASTINSPLTVTGATTLPAATTAGGKNIGPAHTHTNGNGGAPTGGVI